MFERTKKQTVYGLIQKLKGLDSFGINLCEAEIKIDKNCIEIKDKKVKVHVYDESIHIYTKIK